jgi:hypothetical protein
MKLTADATGLLNALADLTSLVERLFPSFLVVFLMLETKVLNHHHL